METFIEKQTTRIFPKRTFRKRSPVEKNVTKLEEKIFDLTRMHQTKRVFPLNIRHE